MKKFFIAFLAFALVAGNLFAEVTWGGYALNAVTVVGGSTEEDSDIIAGNGVSGSNMLSLYGVGGIQARATNDDGTFGAFIRTGVNTGDDANWGYRSFAWWKPVSQFKLQIGFFDDLAVNHVVGGGYHAGDAPDITAFGGSGRAGGWSYDGELTGAVIVLAPVEGLAIKVGVPYAGLGPEAAETYNQIVGQITYDIANVGQIAVTYDSGAGYRAGKKNPSYGWVDKDEDPSTMPTWEPKDTKETLDPGAIHGQFYLTAVDKLQLNVGLKYTLAGTYGEGPAEITATPPIVAGFGAAYAVSDTFGVKGRFAASFAGSVKTAGIEGKTPVTVKFDILPYFDLSIVKVFVFMGIDVALPDQGDATFNWFLSPYVSKSVGGGSFYAGLQVFSSQNKANETIINWGIPIGLAYAF